MPPLPGLTEWRIRVASSVSPHPSAPRANSPGDDSVRSRSSSRYHEVIWTMSRLSVNGPGVNASTSCSRRSRRRTGDNPAMTVSAQNGARGRITSVPSCSAVVNAGHWSSEASTETGRSRRAKVTGSVPARATSSTASRTGGSSPARRCPISCTIGSVPASGVEAAQPPCSSCSSAESAAPVSSARSAPGSPALSAHSSSRKRSVTGPPSTPAAHAPTSRRVRGSTGMVSRASPRSRAANAGLHSAAGSTVATTAASRRPRTSPRAASDAASSRWRSSTASSRRSPPERSRHACRMATSRSVPSRPARAAGDAGRSASPPGMRWPRAAKGTARAASEPATRSTGQPRLSASVAISHSRWVLPMPVPPLSSTLLCRRDDMTRRTGVARGNSLQPDRSIRLPMRTGRSTDVASDSRPSWAQRECLAGRGLTAVARAGDTEQVGHRCCCAAGGNTCTMRVTGEA